MPDYQIVKNTIMRRGPTCRWVIAEMVGDDTGARDAQELVKRANITPDAIAACVAVIVAVEKGEPLTEDSFAYRAAIEAIEKWDTDTEKGGE